MHELDLRVVGHDIRRAVGGAIGDEHQVQLACGIRQLKRIRYFFFDNALFIISGDHKRERREILIEPRGKPFSLECPTNADQHVEQDAITEESVENNKQTEPEKYLHKSTCQWET
ncbi:hypothetical protein D3C86_1899940 [compost metagenome]